MSEFCNTSPAADQYRGHR